MYARNVVATWVTTLWDAAHAQRSSARTHAPDVIITVIMASRRSACAHGRLLLLEREPQSDRARVDSLFLHAASCLERVLTRKSDIVVCSRIKEVGSSLFLQGPDAISLINVR